MVPKRSASAPENGCAAPYSKVCIATDSAKTSRPQPLSLDIGVRKKPSAERGPKPMSEIRQPQTRITAGVRQVAAWVGGAGVLPCMGGPSGGGGRRLPPHRPFQSSRHFHGNGRCVGHEPPYTPCAVVRASSILTQHQDISPVTAEKDVTGNVQAFYDLEALPPNELCSRPAFTPCMAASRTRAGASACKMLY